MDMYGIGKTNMANAKHRRAMLPQEIADFKELQKMAYTYDNYTLPLFQQLYALAPKATKLSQLQCIPIFGNLYVFFLHIRFISRATNFGCLDSSTKMKMVGIAMLTLLVGFIPFVNVWATYKLTPLYSCWRLLSNDIVAKGLYSGVSTAGARTEFITAENDMRPLSQITAGSLKGHNSLGTSSSATLNGTPTHKKFSDKELDDEYNATRRELVGYSSFCPVPGRDTMAATENPDFDEVDEKKRSFECLRVSKLPEEAEFLKAKYPIRKSALDNWPLN
ncbi:hypothetical protein GGH99_002671 [Coemansia sp. RSA 1285]|nr:hypothetical protein GGH99_002671 [Coemansia sp. RSA 1285]